MFDTAFVTLFHVTAGDPWPEELPTVREDGSTDWAVAGFMLSFTIIVIWVILQARRPVAAGVERRLRVRTDTERPSSACKDATRRRATAGRRGVRGSAEQFEMF